MDLSNNKEISSFDLSLLRKYVSRTLSDEETYHIGVFLKKNPEYSELLKELTLADLDRIEKVNSHANRTVVSKLNKGRGRVVYLGIAAVAVIVLGVIIFNSKEAKEDEWSAKQNVNDADRMEIIALDTSAVTPQDYQKVFVADTFYYVNTDEVIPEVAIEFIEDKIEDQKIIQPVHQLTKEDSLPQSVTMIANHSENSNVDKSMAFAAELDYRQSVSVESDFAQAYKVGQTKSFAGEIGGYAYDPKGMPHYGVSESDFYSYLEDQLNADTLLTKINKKMEAKVSFEVNSKGKVENVSVVKCNHKQLCMRLTEIFEDFPDWQPADFKGKKGSVHYVIQVNYK